MPTCTIASGAGRNTPAVINVIGSEFGMNYNISDVVDRDFIPRIPR